MKPETARPVHLKDYRPPAYLIDRVEPRRRARADAHARALEACHPAQSRRRRPARAAAARRRACSSSATSRLDGKPLGPKDYKVTDTALTLTEAAGRPLHAGDHHLRQSGGQQGAAGPLPLARHLLHAVRGAGLPPHHLFPRPAGRARHLHRAHRGRPRTRRPCCSPTATRWSAARSTAASATTRCGTIPTPSPATCSRWSAATWRSIASTFTHHVGAQGRPRHLRRARQGGARRLGHGLAQALHALGRGALRPRVRSRRVQHRRRVRLQHGGDGEQGPQHLQRPPDPGLARDGDRRHLRGASSASSRTSTSTTGPATASPAATGSSSA